MTGKTPQKTRYRQKTVLPRLHARTGRGTAVLGAGRRSGAKFVLGRLNTSRFGLEIESGRPCARVGPATAGQYGIWVW